MIKRYNMKDNANSKEQIKENEIKKEEDINKIKQIKENEEGNKQMSQKSKELLSFIKYLYDFESDLKSLKDIKSILTIENISFLKKVSLKENMKINLLLSNIYMSIITNKSLYDEYLLLINEKDTNKINVLFLLIENCINLIEKLNGFIFSYNLYKFKKKTIDLVKCIYFNCKTKIKEEQLEQLEELMENLPQQLFSDSFLDLNKSKDLYEISKSETLEKIIEFEEKFSEINNYYEQFESFKRFVENNSNSSDRKNNKANKDNIEFYELYGTFILKFCKYYKYIFLEEQKNENKEGNKKEKEIPKSRVMFLIDRINQKNEDKKEEKDEKNKKIENILKNKQFVSSLDSNEYKKLIEKIIKYYLDLTKNIENELKIKELREHLSYYLNNIYIESFYPLYLKDLSKVNINDNFTQFYLTSVIAGKSNKFYFETKYEINLVYIEFYLEDITKDINFQINKYEIDNNEFKLIFKEERIDKFKFFIYCHGYSLYEIIFDNSYSWFNSKDINFKISLLSLYDKLKMKEEDYFDKGREDYIDDKEINIIEEKKINIPVILYLNNLRIVSINKNEKDNNIDLVFNDHKEENELIIPKNLFNNLLIDYIKKLNIEKENYKNIKFIISIFSMNKDLLLINKEIDEQIKNINNVEEKKYINKIGFIPDNKIDDFNLEYKLYDLYEQILIYHMSISITHKTKIAKTILLIQFDELYANASVYNNGKFFTKLKLEEKEINLVNINIDNINELYNLIKNMNEGFEGVHLILYYNNNIIEEKKNKLLEIFEKIKKFNEENIIPPLKIFIYEENEICNKVIKYTNSFYED